MQTPEMICFCFYLEYRQMVCLTRVIYDFFYQIKKKNIQILTCNAAASISNSKLQHIAVENPRSKS